MAGSILAKVSAFLEEIEHAEEARKRSLEERIANMAKATEVQLQIEYNERLASIKNTESQQLLKLYSKIASLKREHSVARHRETEIVSWLNSTLCQDLCERRQVRSAERLLEEVPEPPPRGLVCGEDVIAEVQRALSQGQKALDEQLKEECSKLEDKCRAARARSVEQRRKALGEAAQMRISKQGEHERLASQIRKEEEPTVLKKHMDLIRGLEIILMGDEKGDSKEGARGMVEDNHKHGQVGQGTHADTTKSEHQNENDQGNKPPEIQEQNHLDRQLEVRAGKGIKVNQEKAAGQEVQRIQTPSPAQEKAAAREIKKAWNAYVSFQKRFEKRPHYRLTFGDITWPVLPPITDANGITHTKISKFLFSLHHSVEIPQNVRLRDALVRWDPEKFESQWMDRIVERDKRRVKEAVEAVMRGLLHLRAEESL